MKPSLSVLYVGNHPGYFQPLENKGEIELKTVSSSVRGIKYLSEGNKTDVIFSDFSLSGSNGLFFFDWIRTQPGYDKIPFILLSNEFRSEIYKTAYQKKVDDYYSLAQPVPEELNTRLRFLVNFKKKKGVYVDEKSMPNSACPFPKGFLILLFRPPHCSCCPPFSCWSSWPSVSNRKEKCTISQDVSAENLLTSIN